MSGPSIVGALALPDLPNGVHRAEEEAVRDEPESSSSPAAFDCAILRCWRSADPAWFDASAAPPPRDYIARRPDGEGFLPRGELCLLAGAGGGGKTLALIELAVAVATGRPWFGHFTIPESARHGRVLLILAEEDETEVWRRLHVLASELRLSPEECVAAASRIVVAPLGRESPEPFLELAEDRRTCRVTPAFLALRERLEADAAEGWALVGIDPLAHFAGPLGETDSHSANVLTGHLRTLTRAPGSPVVLAVHHSSKQSIRDGEPDARGSSALVAGARWLATLAIERDGSGKLRLAKSNYSAPLLEVIELRRARGGYLRAADELELVADRKRQEQGEGDREREKGIKAEARIRAAEEELLRAIGAAVAPVTTRDDAVNLGRGFAGTTKETAFSRLLASGRIVRVGPARGGRYVVAGPGASAEGSSLE